MELHFIYEGVSFCQLKSAQGHGTAGAGLNALIIANHDTTTKKPGPVLKWHSDCSGFRRIR